MNNFIDVKDVAIHDFAIFLSRNPGALSTWDTFQRLEQQYRDQLLERPGTAGASQVEIVLDDLKKLSSGLSGTAA